MNAYEVFKREILAEGLPDLTIEITADDSACKEALSRTEAALQEWRREEARRMAWEIDEMFMSAFFIPAPRIERCPVCREQIDLDKVNAVGPRGTDVEGKIIHRLCEIKVLQEQRNQELAEKRGETYIPF